MKLHFGFSSIGSTLRVISRKCSVLITAPNKIFNNLMGPLRFSKGDLYKTFPAEKVTLYKGELFSWKGLVKVTFNLKKKKKKKK